MLVKSKASCFIDCIELGLQANAQTIARDYRDIVNNPDVDPDTEGYHPSIVNQCLLERFGKGLCEIDVLPVGEDGEKYSDDPTGYVTRWFKRPGFQCVVTGPRTSNGEEHANAYTNGQFFDADGTPLEEPNIQIRTVWVLGVPMLRAEPEPEVEDADPAE
jgi:hypothetical protein